MATEPKLKTKIKWLYAFIALISLLIPVIASAAPTVFTQRSPDHHDDTQNAYGSEILKLVLENTKQDYGDYVIETAPVMNIARATYTLSNETRPNFLYATVYNTRLQKQENLTYIPFPLVQGLLGYRVCFYPSSKPDFIAGHIKHNKLDELLHGQGKGWTDSDVLKYNGFPVVEIESHKSLYKMVAAGRIDLFCRGAIEAFKEYNHFNNIEGISFDRTFVMQYDLPVFFYTNKNNTKAIERVQKGLIRAYENGKLRQLLFKHYSQSLEFVDLEKRKFFYLANPHTEDLNPEYKKYYLFPRRNQ